MDTISRPRVSQRRFPSAQSASRATEVRESRPFLCAAERGSRSVLPWFAWFDSAEQFSLPNTPYAELCITGNAHGAKGAGQLRLTRRSRDSALFWGFNPAVSASALKAMRATIRELDLRRRTHVSMGEIARLRTIRTLGTVPFAQIRQLNASGLGDAEIQAL
jgi:hypothetical protein